MQRKNSYIIWGIVLIAFGVLIVLNQLDIIRMTGYMIPAVIMLGLALVFHLCYALGGRSRVGFLVPGGIMLLYGVHFLLGYIFGSNLFGKLWPLFVLGPALGLFELYVFSRGRSGSMVPVFILTTIGGAALLRSFFDFSFFLVIGAALVILGVVLFCGAFRRQKQAQAQAEQDNNVPLEREEARVHEEPKVHQEPPAEEPFFGSDAPTVDAQPMAEEPADNDSARVLDQTPGGDTPPSDI